MSWGRRGVGRRWALWVLLLAGAPVRAQDAQVPRAREAAPATAADRPGHLAPPPSGSPDVTPSPAETPPLGTPAETRPVIDPPLSAPPAAPAGTRPVVDPPVSAPPTARVPPARVGPGLPATVAGPVPEEHRHSDFFFHADLGGGYFRVSGSRGASSFTTDGGALGVGLALGWSPNDEWAIGLELWSWKSLTDSGLGKDTSVELQALGLNVTRYLVPADVFASVVVSGTRLAITDPSDHIEYGASDIGFGFKVLLGKEWRVTSWLGLGLAGELFLSVNRDSSQTLRTLGGGLVFSITGR